MRGGWRCRGPLLTDVSLGLTLAGPDSLSSWHSDENLGGSMCGKHTLGYSPDSSVGKESTCNAGDPSSIPGLGRSPGEGIGYPLQFLGFPCGSAGKESACNAGDLAWIPWLGRSPGGGNGYPLQYSGLENPMVCIVHGVTKSRTRLSIFRFQGERAVFLPRATKGSQTSGHPHTWLPSRSVPHDSGSQGQH